MHMIGSLRPAFSPLARTQLAFNPTPYSMGHVRLGQATPSQLAQLENFNGLGLQQMLAALDKADVNVLVKDLGVERSLAFTAALVKKSGQMMSSALDTTYDKYKGTPKGSLGSWAETLALTAPGPTAAYVYFQGNSQHRAVVQLESVKRLGNGWLADSIRTWFGGSTDPALSWVDEYDVIDKADSDAVGATFDQVVASEARVIDLTAEIEELPEHVILEAIGLFYAELKKTLKKASDGIAILLKAIEALMRMLGYIIVGAAKFAAAFPAVVLLGAAGLLIWKLS
jgi:hypothetical protein